MESILFSIVVPTYNRAHLIAKTLNSVLAQTYSNFEVIVVDDGSKDNTQEVVAAFTDKRIKYFLKENGERAAARNFGVQKAKGDYINFFDSDDLMYPHHLLTAFNFIQANNPAWFHLGYDFKDVEDNVIKQFESFDESINKKIIFDNRLSCNGVFIRKDILNQNLFHENRRLASSEDWELWIRLLAQYPLLFDNTITSSVVNHDARSLFTIPADKVIARDELLIQLLHVNPLVQKIYRNQFNKFIAERYSFFMLCLSEQKRKKEVFNWAYRAFKIYPRILFTKRYLASIKNSI
ncbi:MAG: glycosyltransferase family 2 protein [Cyclobacteriaceae bacterium]|jgi:glycosyltransferase involved in cell wall biosynthesis|nr:glycosyltransferase family 2 protein [Cyclobacteriaceae bacterium]